MKPTATGAGGAIPVRLRLVVVSPGATPHDLEIQADATSRVEDVVTAVSRALGLPADRRLSAFSTRTRAWLSTDSELGSSGLSHGDEVLLLPDRALPDVDDNDPSADCELLVVGGSQSGQRFPLSIGEVTLGRDPDCTIALDDPSLSAKHLAITVGPARDLVLVDSGSRNGTVVAGTALTPGEPTPLLAGEIVQAGRTLFRVDHAEPATPPPAPEPDGSVPFNRPPRVNRPITPVERSFAAPPADPHRARIPLIASLVPLVLGVGLYLLTGLATMLFFAALTPLMAISSFVEDRRGGKGAFARDARKYREKLRALTDELEGERADQIRTGAEIAPPPPDLLRRARLREPSLWERRGLDPDFLSLRIGTGDQPSALTMRIEQGGNEELRREAEQLTAWYATVPMSPVVAPLAELGAVGLCGPPERVGSLARWLVAQAAALHSPRELVIAAALSPERVGEWDWLKWLPHTHSETSPVATHLSSGELGARELLDEALALIEQRRSEGEGTYAAGTRRTMPSVLLVLDELVAPERPLVGKLLSTAAEYGIASLWLGSDRRDLPGECGGIVELDPAAARLTFTDARAGKTTADVTADGLSVDLARELALSLAPVRDTGALAAGGGVPERVDLLELVDVERVTADWVAERWREEPETRTALIGAAPGAALTVDLRSDGPHALIAGTTGAGKSELLQTLISSLALGNPPTRVNFLLVDYKGGAAFKECVGLPHTVGFVTDLDGHLAQRALASLNAELRRRERILNESGAKDLPDLEHRDPDRAPASLVIVIDEFATLAKEVPDFVEGVVDVAQRGRSLGVHLVLATQRPGGVVSENIRANTNLRIALRVNETSESTDVIGAPSAARIARGRPGRGYARTGHGELTEFQTAYVGGSSMRRGDDDSVVARLFPFESERELSAGAGRGRESDLDRIVRAAAEAAHSLELPRSPSPWLPPLEPVLPLDSLRAPESADASAVAVVGLVDEPTRQSQSPLTLDLEQDGSVLLYGASGSGKTTFLRTLAVSLARQSAPGDLNLYGLDFATRGLAVLENLPHCGSVIAGEDEERVSRLFARLRRTMDERKVLFARHGVFTLSEYRRRADGEPPQPRILVLLDNYAGFATAFERVNLGQLVETLPRLVGDGRPLGVHFAIGADRRGAVPNSLAGIIPTKIVLRLADEDDYSALGIPLKTARGAQLPPGRGFLPNGLEVQTALVGNDPSGEGQGTAMDALAEELRARWPGEQAAAVELLPALIERTALPVADRSLTAVVGIGDTELEPISLDLAESHFLVVGPYRSGRSGALSTIAESLRESSPSVELHLLAPRRSPLLELACWTSAARGAEQCEQRIGQIQEHLEAVQSGEASEQVVVVIDDGDELADGSGAAILETIARRGRDAGIRVVAAAERQAAQRAFGGWLRELRKDEYGLLLDPDSDVDGDILGVRLPRRSNPVFPPGRGYLVERGKVELVQVAGERVDRGRSS